MLPIPSQVEKTRPPDNHHHDEFSSRHLQPVLSCLVSVYGLLAADKYSRQHCCKWQDSILCLLCSLPGDTIEPCMIRIWPDISDRTWTRNYFFSPDHQLIWFKSEFSPCGLGYARTTDHYWTLSGRVDLPCPVRVVIIQRIKLTNVLTPHDPHLGLFIIVTE